MAALARYFAVNPDSTPTMQTLGRATGLSWESLSYEIERLQDLGLIQCAKRGSRVECGIIHDNPRWFELRAHVRRMSTPEEVLWFALGEIRGVEGAFIFGSFASGREGNHSDVDLFIVGDEVDESTLSRRTIEASVLLGREVNVVQSSLEEFRAARESSRFHRDVAQGAKQWIVDRNNLSQDSAFATELETRRQVWSSDISESSH
jgi:predicted nucleotidyltransferase